MASESLLLLRHGRAAPGGEGGDAGRALTTVGERQARIVGVWLREAGLLPRRVWCSTAVRATDTAHLLLEAAGLETRPRLMPELYDGGTAAAHALLERAGGAEAGRLLLVGHNPVLEELLARLSGCAGAVPMRLAPGSLALLEPVDEGYAVRCLVSPELLSPASMAAV